MAITNVSSARRAGFTIENKSIKDGAGIAVTKIGTRQLYYSLSPDAFALSGAGMTRDADGMFYSVTMPDANTATLATAFAMPLEWTSGDVIFHIYWKTSATSGNAKFFLEGGTRASGQTTNAGAVGNVVTAADATANKLIKSTITASSGFSASEYVVLRIYRDPTDGSDDLNANLDVIGIVMEYTGRA